MTVIACVALVNPSAAAQNTEPASTDAHPHARSTIKDADEIEQRFELWRHRFGPSRQLDSYIDRVRARQYPLRSASKKWDHPVRDNRPSRRSPDLFRETRPIAHNLGGAVFPETQPSTFSSVQSLPVPTVTAISDPAAVSLPTGELIVAYKDWGIPGPCNRCLVPVASKLWVVRSPDGGVTWETPILIEEAPVLSFFRDSWWGYYLELHFNRLDSGRLILTEEAFVVPNRLFYSDDDGLTWTSAPYVEFSGPAGISDRFQGPIDGELWHLSGQDGSGQIQRRRSADGLDWTTEEVLYTNDASATTDLSPAAVLLLPSGDVLATFSRTVFDPCCSTSVALSTSSDGGANWSDLLIIGLDESDIWPYDAGVGDDGTVWLTLTAQRDEAFADLDVFYTSSVDSGKTWSPPQKFSGYAGHDRRPSIALIGSTPVVFFGSDRTIVHTHLPNWVHAGPSSSGVWFGIPGVSSDDGANIPPAIRSAYSAEGFQTAVVGGGAASIAYHAVDESGPAATVHARIRLNGSDAFTDVQLFDDGLHGDLEAGDHVWSGPLGVFARGDILDVTGVATDADLNVGMWGGETLYSLGQHDVGNVTLTLGKNSGLGFIGASEMGALTFGPNLLGNWKWPKVEGHNYLYAGGLTIGIGDVSDYGGPVVHGMFVPGFSDWEPLGPLEFSQEISDQDVVASYTDADAPNGSIGLAVTQTSYQWSDELRDDFIIIEYELGNDGALGDYTGVHAALWLDPDMPLEGVGGWRDDRLAYDPSSRIIYQFDSGQECTGPSWPVEVSCPEGYMGIAWLSDRNGRDPFSATDFDSDARETEMWGLITGGIAPHLQSGVPLEPADYRVLIATEPFDLAAGARHTEAFGIVTGRGLQEMLTNAATMREVYETEVSKTGVAIDDFDTGILPDRFALRQNYPNPFNPSTVISFDLPAPAEVSLKIFDVLGREVETLVSERRSAGRHHEKWNASGVASGVYLYRLEAGDFSRTRTLTLIK